jgi:hypothetical protein
MKRYIVESGGKYLIVDVHEYKGHYYSKIHEKNCNTLDMAYEYVTILDEDGVPVNSMSGGNISTFSPLLLKKIGKRRLANYIKSKRGQ